jgi:Ni/Co efflux regulator RcnB
MKRILTAALALAIVGGGAAEAKNEGKGRGEGRGEGRRQSSERGYERREIPSPQRRWERGERLPGAYRGGPVDYRNFQLRRPPRGYQWVNVGGDFLLMDTNSGLVLEVIPRR